ncbi:quinone-dependent dihydroorotate dehydrogenase [Aequorivita viscosa]|nr:quinone-dependent dihydroorotate dehydrogenase [Aequorivita viscosa]
MYKTFIRPLFFRFDPEKIHHFTFSLVQFFHKIGFGSIFRSIYKVENPKLERELFGLKFPNPVGLAAGFDKDAKLYKELSNFGFGFIEIGTVTPKPQPGNEKPRLFRLKEDSAIINRMGFNNGGVEEAVERLKANGKAVSAPRNDPAKSTSEERSKRPVAERSRSPRVLIGGNIGKNKITPNEEAVNDYIICFEALFDYVDYFVVNVSSPNTPNLRALQEKKPLTDLLQTLQEKNNSKAKRKPILLKIAPDLTDEQLLDIIEIVETTQIDGVIATNTTISRDGLASENKKEMGGLSGKPLNKRGTEVIRFLSEKSNKAFPIIGVGGIHSAEDALEKLDAGASLVQLYTGFIYEGPGLIKEINKAILKRHKT